ncbi:hypothetical protein BDF19DRAFT_435236 [Syncephalis fuscata]|nr:hypothetical protein BDF19DRAFT_435236 [Syncephalis fuscata]
MSSTASTVPTAQDDPLRARSYQFWRKEFIPLFQRDCIGSSDITIAEATAESATLTACEQRQAIIYASASALEAIKWSCPGGVAALLDAGAFSVQCIDDITTNDTPPSCETAPLSPPTAHILIDGQLLQYEQQLKTLWSNEKSQLKHVHLWLGLPEGMQTPPSSISTDDISNSTQIAGTAQEEEEVQQRTLHGLDRWKIAMSSWHRSITVEVHYAPALLWACISKCFYVTPSCTDVFPALDVVIEDETEPVSNHFTEAQREGLRSLGALLSVTLAELHYKSEFFVIGESAKYVARQCHRLGAYAASHGRVGGSGAAVIIIDRTVDLVAPSWHQDNLMDEIYRVLQRRSVRDGSLDLSASIEPKLSTTSSTTVSAKLCSIAHGLNEECFDLVDSMIMSGQKDGLNLVRKCLSDIITFENPQAKIPRSMGRVTPALLNKLLSVFQDERDQKLRHAALVELTAAVVQTLQESPKMMWDELAALEKTLSLSIGDAQQISEHLQGAVPKVNETGVSVTRMRKSYSVVDAMLLALSVYSLGGDVWRLPEEMEMILIDRWFAALLAGQRSLITYGGINSEADQLLQSIGVLNSAEAESSTETDDQIKERRIRVGNWFEHSQYAQHLTGLRHLLRNESLLPYTPFVQQLFENIYATEASDEKIWNIRLLSNTKPHPRNYRHIVLCVVGGITFNEVRILRELTMTESINLIVISTDIATGHTLFRHVFTSI